MHIPSALLRTYAQDLRAATEYDGYLEYLFQSHSPIGLYPKHHPVMIPNPMIVLYSTLDHCPSQKLFIFIKIKCVSVEIKMEKNQQKSKITYDVFSKRLVHASFLRIFVTLFHMNRLSKWYLLNECVFIILCQRSKKYCHGRLL